MNPEQELQAIELSIEQAKTSINKMEDLLKLTNNKEFTNIILKGYFETEASRIVLVKADPAMQNDNDQADLDKSIIAIGYLRQYLNTIMQMGRMSQKALNDDEAMREEILATSGEV